MAPPDVADVVSGPQATSTVAGVLLPLLVGLVTTRNWPPPAKGLTLLVCSFVLATGTELVDSFGWFGAAAPFEWQAVLAATFTTWMAAQTAHAALWKRTALSGRLQDLGSPPAADEPDNRSVGTVVARVRAEREEPMTGGRHGWRGDEDTRPPTRYPSA